MKNREGITSRAYILSLAQKQSSALLMDQNLTGTLSEGSSTQFEAEPSYPVNLRWGQNQTARGKLISEQTTEDSGHLKVDLAQKLTKTQTISRQLVNGQLTSGHMRLDLGRPMTKGNFILFKGVAGVGKTSVAHSVVRQFVKEDAENKAIYVGLNA